MNLVLASFSLTMRCLMISSSLASWSLSCWTICLSSLCERSCFFCLEEGLFDLESSLKFFFEYFLEIFLRVMDLFDGCLFNEVFLDFPCFSLSLSLSFDFTSLPSLECLLGGGLSCYSLDFVLLVPTSFDLLDSLPLEPRRPIVSVELPLVIFLL